MNDRIEGRAAASDGTRTGWSMAMSVIVHALLLAGIILQPPPRVAEALTEITLLDEGESGSPAPHVAAPTRAPERQVGATATDVADARFRRLERSAAIAPDPQAESAVDDRMNARLAALQRDLHAPAAGVASSAPASPWGGAPAPVAGFGGGGASSVALRRGGAGTSPALTLTRGGGTGPAPALVPAPAQVARPTAEEPARGGDATARRTLAGATLMGPIADRPVQSHVTPAYPDWAKREAVEGSVTLYFIVSPDGRVRENVLVQKTAGFEDFDESARTALRAWRFEPLHGGRTGDQWGTITFHFRLREGG